MSYLRDTIALTGIALTLYGIGMLSVPAACVAGGVVLALAAVLWSWISRKEPQ